METDTTFGRGLWTRIRAFVRRSSAGRQWGLAYLEALPTSSPRYDHLVYRPVRHPHLEVLDWRHCHVHASGAGRPHPERSGGAVVVPKHRQFRRRPRITAATRPAFGLRQLLARLLSEEND